jgi:fumarate reductase subunit D
MSRRRVEPLVWLMFSAGGVLAAMFLPILVLLFGLAFPLGWLDPPDYEHLRAVISHPVTLVVLFGLFVLMLVHSAHRSSTRCTTGSRSRRSGPSRCSATAARSWARSPPSPCSG